MIYVGDHDRAGVVRRYAEEHGIRKVYVLGDPLDGLEGCEFAPWRDVDKYRVYNVFRTVITGEDLVVLNEVLRDAERNCLKYNCLRQYVVQTRHRLVFQRLPFVSSKDDAAALFDMTTENPFLKLPVDEVWGRIRGVVRVRMPAVAMHIDRVSLPPLELAAYEAEKDAIFSRLKGSPSLLPAQCLKASERLAMDVVGYRQYDSKSRFKLDGRYLESQTGVDRYFADILRAKARWVEEWREMEDGE